MSYIAGAYGLSRIGIPDGDARIVCDGCGLAHPIGTRTAPPQWFLDGKYPRGWVRTKTVPREDFCAKCREVRA